MQFLKTIGFLFILISICSCEVKNDIQPKPKVEDSNFVLLDTVTLTEFNDMKDRWDQKGKKYIATHQVLNYFDIPEFDVNQVGNNANAVKTRAYMALDSIPASGTDTMYYVPHLLLVAIDSRGAFTGSIFDYTSSCPPICPK